MKFRQLLVVWAGISFFPFAASAQIGSARDPLAVFPRERVTETIRDIDTVAIGNHRHPRARSQDDAGSVPDDFNLTRMILGLQRDTDQQAAMDTLAAQQQDPRSPQYHQWLTPQSFGAHFGISLNDLDKIAAWLTSEGFTVDEIPAGHSTIVFSGTAAQVERAFHVPIHYFRSDGELHYANAGDPQIPRALAGLVTTIDGLHDFRARPAARVSRPRISSGNVSNYMEPSDFTTIYNLNPLYSSGINGKGVTIGVIEPCTIDSAVVNAFETLEGLPQQFNLDAHGNALPCTMDTEEAFLDYEWTVAVAPSAQTYLVATASRSVLDAVNAAVNDTDIKYDVLTVSYGACEVELGGANVLLSSIWQQAHMSGIVGLVASGDSGAAGCDDPTKESPGTQGLAVSGYCTPIYVVCVGGTEFNEGANFASYWSEFGTALKYIPEVAWNESDTNGGSGLWSSGGGYSTLYQKPSWQTGNSTANRGVPDVAMSAASHDPYRVCATTVSDCNSISYVWLVSGTSAATPVFAGIMALVVQEYGRQGNVQQSLYSLAARTDAQVFHDIVSGNNSVPGLMGYNAGAGWDPVTGLGSVDANALVRAWSGASAFPAVTNLEMTKTPPAASGCAVPPASTAFLTTDNTAYLFFEATVTASDNLSNDWLAPNGDVVAGKTWSPVNGSTCFTGESLNISSPKSGHFGAWQARVYDNGTQIASLSFSISAPASNLVISSISPASAVAASAAFTLTVNGTGFASGATVLWNTTPLTTSFVSSTQITASVPSSLIATAGSASITVSNSGSVSSAATFTISAVPGNLSRLGVLPHIAAGGGWDTAVYLTNTSAAPVSVAVAFHADDGSAFTLPLAVTQQGKTQSSSTSTLSTVIPPNTTVAVDTGTLSATTEGWADVMANGALSGFAVFRYAPGGLSGGAGVATPWEGTVPLQTQLTPSTVVLPFDNTGGFADGLALGNLSGSPVQFTATFYDLNGNPLGSPQTIALAGNGHTSFLLNAQYAFTANVNGIMKVTGGPLMAIGLRASPYGTLTSVPLPLQ